MYPLDKMIEIIVTQLGKTLVSNQSVKDFMATFSKEAIAWIKPLFLKEDGSEKEMIQNLKAKPDSPARQKAVVSTLEMGLEDNPVAEKYLREIFEKLMEKDGGKIVNTTITTGDITITNTENANAGVINTGGGNVSIG